MIKDVIVKKLQKNEDPRGWLIEIYRRDEVKYKPAMAYVSVTNPGVVRGPHEHKKQFDCFVFVGPGNFRLYLWDNRKNSPTYGENFVEEFGEVNAALVIVPPGVVHGYQCVSDMSAWTINFPDQLYRGRGKKKEVDEIRWEGKEDSPFKIEN